MGLKLRHLRLRVQTEDGMFGTDIPFGDGLTVLWADNTKGKSTCVQSIVYALGLERMLSSQREIPLPYAMTDYLKEGDVGAEREHAVHTSTVWLEIENDEGVVIGLRRRVKADQSSKLISVFPGGIPAEGNIQQSKDYFVRDPGAATRDAGFHTFLAQFLGWKLPTVTKYDGTEALLYLETIFPLFYVEQKFGWSAFPAAFPTYLGIRDMGRKAVEFVLDLDTHAIELERERLTQALQAVRADWSAKREGLVKLATADGVDIRNLPATPDVAFSELNDVALVVEENDTVEPLSEAIASLKRVIAESRRQEAPTSGQVAPEAAAELARLNDQLTTLNARRTAIYQRRNLEYSQLRSLSERLDAIEADLRKNKDVKKLERLGSENLFNEDRTHCPTCEQPISDGLLPQQVLGSLMSVEQNIAFLESQRSIFGALLRQAERSAAAASDELVRATASANELSGRIRALKADLTAPANAPSESVIENRVRWERKARILQSLEVQVEEVLDNLREISATYVDLIAQKNELPADRLSDEDRGKVDAFVSLIREQLGRYGFSTFAPDQLTVSENFRVEKEGFEIGFQTSASDSIRLKWAYQLALLEVARTRITNHAGLVVFDEPRQQEASKTSFRQLLKRAEGAKSYDQQVFFATSEDVGELKNDLSNVECTLLIIDGWTLKRIEG